MNLLKYAAKLRKMSANEVIFRLRQKARNSAEQLRCRMDADAAGRDLFVPPEVRNWDLQRFPFPNVDHRFFGLADHPELLRRRYQEAFPQRMSAIVEAAERLMDNQFTLLGLDLRLPARIDWNINPQSGVAYPLDHHTMMDPFDTGRYGDVKYVWELNRHQFFIELGKAYFLTGDERYVKKIWSWLESWIEDTPHKFGINHTSVLEHSVRIFSWIWMFYFTSRSPVWTQERRRSLVQNLVLHGEMIEENLSWYYSPYNHLIGELAALAFLGTVCGANKKMKRWRDQYWLELEAQMSFQFHPDGFTIEQASYYHHFTTGFYLMLAILRKQNRLPVEEHTWAMLEQTLDFPMNLTRPDGQLPMIGDIDSARSIYFYPPDPQWNLRPFLALGASLFSRADMKFVAREPAEESLWLLGLEGLNRFDELESKVPEKQSRSYTSSGYYVMRDGWGPSDNYLCVDGGEIAHGVYKDETPSAAHGHGDILSFELCLQGQPLIIDPGFFTYFGDLAWHQYFRSTRGHNAIEVNGAGQAIHEGRIGWSAVSSPEEIVWVNSTGFDLFAGSIDRFAGIGRKIKHWRHILCRRGAYFLVMDLVDGESAGEQVRVESSFHFHPGRLELEYEKLLYNGAAVGHFAPEKDLRMEISSGGEAAHAGWMSTGYGCREAAPVLRFFKDGPLPVMMGMVFPLRKYRDVSRISKTKVEEGVFCVELFGMLRAERVYFNPQQRRFRIPGEAGLETDAFCTVVRLGRSNESTVTALHFTTLLFEGSAVGAFTPPVRGVTLQVTGNEIVQTANI